MLVRQYVLSTAAALLLVAPSIAGAQTAGGDSIVVQNVKVHNGEYHFLESAHSNESNTIDVRFANRSADEVTKVVFSVRSDGAEVGQLTEDSAVAGNASVTRHYENSFDSMEPLTDATVVPVEVDYANGHTWSDNSD